jgi:Calcineurin-like phosphoesterase
MTKILVVQLSDIHIETAQDLVLRKAEAIAAVVSTANDQPSRLLLVATGDIAYSGKPEQYKLAERFLHEIKAGLEKRLSISVDVIVAPGNHDCDFDSEGNETRHAVLETIRQRKNGAISEELLKACCKVQLSFDAFRGGVETLPCNFRSPLWRSCLLEVDTKKILVHVVNTAWCSELENGLGAHEFPTDQHQECTEDRADLRIVLMHHPYHWLNNARYREFEKLIRKSSELVFTGHEHIANAGQKSDSVSHAASFFEGGVLQERPNIDASTFQTCSIDLQSRSLSALRYSWTGSMYVGQPQKERKAEIQLATPSVREFAFQHDWLSTLRDLGAAIAHPAKLEVTLNDVYVFPEFEISDEKEELPILISGESLLDRVNKEEVIAVFSGEQSSGKTSWLKIAAQTIHERGKIPIFIRGAELIASAGEDLRRVVRRAVEQQYGSDRTEAILQKDRDCKVVLIDGIDRYKFPDRYFNSVIEFFKKEHRSILMTAEHMMSVQAAVDRNQFASLQDFEKYEIGEFGIKARFELAKRWFELTPITRRGEEAERRNRIEQTDKTISALIGRGLVPAYPIFLLVLLQGVEAGQSGELENGALGEYYNYLISHSLLQKVRRDDLKAIFDYCDHFAWCLFQSQATSLGEIELAEFNLAYRRRMDVAGKFDNYKRVLLDCKLWAETDAGLSFRYPYARYFFLGRHLARELIRNQEVMAVVEGAVKNLHVRENGNIVTFLTHFSNDPRVIELLVLSVAARFDGDTPLRLDHDVDPLNKLVLDAPRLVYQQEKVVAQRHKLLSQDHQTSHGFERATGEASETGVRPEHEVLKFLGELNGLFKGVEILGSAIKAQATSMPGDEKQRLLKVVFDGGLRGVTNFLKQVADDPDTLVSQVMELLDRKKPTNIEVREELAKKAIFVFIAWLLYWFVRRVGASIGSSSLQPAIERYVRDNPTVANQLVGISSLLETPAPIPFDRLQKLNDDLKSLALAQNVLRHLAYMRLHMYQTEVRERQQLLQELGIDMDSQRAADYKTRNTKKLKKGGRHKRNGKRRH